MLECWDVRMPGGDGWKSRGWEERKSREGIEGEGRKGMALDNLYHR